MASSAVAAAAVAPMTRAVGAAAPSLVILAAVHYLELAVVAAALAIGVAAPAIVLAGLVGTTTHTPLGLAARAVLLAEETARRARVVRQLAERVTAAVVVAAAAVRMLVALAAAAVSQAAAVAGEELAERRMAQVGQ